MRLQGLPGASGVLFCTENGEVCFCSRDFDGASELMTLLRVNQEELNRVDEHQESVSFGSGPSPVAF